MSVKVKWDDKNKVLYSRKYLGKTKAGKAICPRKSFPEAKNEAEAQVMADEWESRLTANGTVHSTRLTDLLDEYIDLRERNGASPNSIKGYRSYMKCHIGPAFDGRLAADVTVHELNDFEQMLLTPADSGGAGLCRNTVCNIHHFMRAAFNHLVKEGVVDTNPFILVANPRPQRHEAQCLNDYDFTTINRLLAEQLGKSDESVKWRDFVFCFADWLALHTGMRCGEVAAVRLCDVMQSQGCVRVSGNVVIGPQGMPFRREDTKGHKSRNVSLTKDEFAAVRAYMGRRERELGRSSSTAPLVTVEGAFMRPATISAAFMRFARANGFPPGFTFHGLRHTHATWCLMNGIDVKTVSERLGHADVSTTLRIYAHVMPGRDQSAAEAFNRAAKEAVNGVATD